MDQMGEQIKKARKIRNLTLKEVSFDTGLSISMLSQIENDKVSPSINSLRKIAQVLNVSMISFFEGQYSEEIIVKKNERRQLSRSKSGIRYELLEPDINRKMEAVMITVDAGYQEPSDFFSHDGEEWILVVQGQLYMEIENRIYTLNEGDAIYFECSKMHRICNASKEETKIVAVATPPSF